MKKWTVQYEDTRGRVHTEEIQGYDYKSAKQMLKYPIREIYWSEPLIIY